MLLATALMLAPVAAHAATYEFHTTQNGKTDKSSVILAPKALCMSNQGVADTSSMTDGTMVYVQDPPTIYYSRAGKVEKLDQARIDQMQGQMQAALGPNSDIRKKIEEALAKVPPERREMMRKQMEKMMGAAMPKAPAAGEKVARTFKATGKTATKNGYKAVEYTVMEGSKKVGDAYLTPISAIPQGEALIGRLQSMMNMIKGLVSQFGMGNNMTDEFLNLPKGYFPVAATSFDDNGKVESEMMLADVSKDTPASCKIPE
jgi:hypothetical protein